MGPGRGPSVFKRALSDEIRDEQPGDEEAQRTRLTVRLLTGVGFLATAAGFVTDLSLTDVVAVAGGLASLGVVTAGGAALSILLRRRSLSAKVEELQELRQEISVQDHKDIGDAAVRQVDEVIDARIGELERRLSRAGWRQGAIFAVFGTAVAVLLIVFGHWLPTIK